jgi:hypothetical protein
MVLHLLDLSDVECLASRSQDANLLHHGCLCPTLVILNEDGERTDVLELHEPALRKKVIRQMVETQFVVNVSGYL